MNPKATQHLRSSLALLMSEYSEQEWSARWMGDLKGIIEEEFWFEFPNYVSLCSSERDERLVLDVDNKEEMLQLAIFAMSHLLGGLIDFDEYWEINL